ncbi:hypothetical protein KIN20_006026 [Parelaphostrongylus tenuis]|uniref:G-patch domain-containing protein n=1 Tax=Parelaphostrongylus tenuis TaxID=148309 RepID=A0AAD5MJR8_PARTN|nr:hypothetical protein KIN20_006026 [Parelaphostrongylus tenuis]
MFLHSTPHYWGSVVASMYSITNSGSTDRLFTNGDDTSSSNSMLRNLQGQSDNGTSGQELFYCTIRNIPSWMRSKDLRRYFSDYTENEKFHCFHFRHRPELQKESAEPVIESGSVAHKKKERPTTCCVISFISSALRSEFIRDFHGRHWVNNEGMEIPRRCFVNAIKVAKDDESTSDSVTHADLRQMIELRPPIVMPRGNVGTPTQYFMEQIRLCRLPSSLISKLGLTTTRRNRKYGSVSFRYTQDDNIENELCRGESFVDESHRRYVFQKSLHDKESSIRDQALPTDPTEKILQIDYGPDNDAGRDDDDDQCEEWERHEALHDDVTEQERIKPRKYEEEMEIIWEKGGPGLVWYTDKNYWDEREKGTDCDWAWADDWDVDYSVYYEGKSAGTKDARDAVEMREDEARRSGKLEESVFTKQQKSNRPLRKRRNSDTSVADIEQYTRGIGSKLLGRMGWKPGSGLGRLQQGRVDPVAIQLEEDGQTGVEKIGLGYRGEKMQRTGFRKVQKIHAIASSFDAVTDKMETPYKRVGNEAFGEILFEDRN